MEKSNNGGRAAEGKAAVFVEGGGRCSVVAVVVWRGRSPPQREADEHATKSRVRKRAMHLQLVVSNGKREGQADGHTTERRCRGGWPPSCGEGFWGV